MSQEPVITVKDLTVALPRGADREHAVEGVSLSLAPGEVLCVVGESGSGKSVTANAMMGLLPKEVRPVAGTIEMDGRNLLTLSEREWQDLRGSDIAMIFQEPMTALNPLQRIGDQIAEVFEAHGALSSKERQAKALSLIEEVGLPDPEKAVRAYPFELSGGQRQRAMIAMALALEPKLLIADEPTTALDVTTQAQILELMADLRRRRGMAILFITHDFGVVAEIGDRVVVMRYGEVVEQGTVGDVLGRPTHPYTQRLIAAVPPLTPPPPRNRNDDAPILTVEGLNKTFRSGGGLFSKARVVKAVTDVTFKIGRGETLGIVGESGSGKSTAGRCIVRLLDPDSGAIDLLGEDWSAKSGAALRQARKRVQMIFQDPYASLNPRRKVASILTEGPVANGVAREKALARAQELIGLVGLDPSALDRFPHEFSGGQRQRIGIARALAMDPEVLVADEAVSALDVSVQAQVLELLADIRDRFHLALIFITHDLCVAAQICDRIAVMRRGEIVEMGPTEAVFGNPQHSYTQALLGAVPGWGENSPLAEGRRVAGAAS
ncbi:MAG: ABC transporter ATP-binding protein [Pseudomonadota bacterium]